MSRAALLVLADGRFPAGGHAHSGGAEAAVKAGRITGAASLEEYCRGRLHTAGLVAGAFAAAAVLGVDVRELDAAADARTPSAALRGAARRLGRQLLRAARVAWPAAELDAVAREFPKGAHQPVVLGVVARAAGLSAQDAAYCAVYECVSGPATAVVRLLSLDPFEATGVLARLAGEMDLVVDRGVEAARRVVAGAGVEGLPAASAPLTEIGAEWHGGWAVRLFAS
ncbi:MAG: urease accessory protein UreF [Streptomyces sp.]|uniref:urease accessory protein UreF n=1 Tax=Streptomyces sp. TaxID=1931 RepID=UPI0025D80CAB|nr:urease accessory UreF family protein [Streptomyces sp.]MBW8795644.1 urease accessory protein UreF [Streptomyces sp.]